MMGSPYYYDVQFDPVDMIFHDCMWSGTCCIQLVQPQPDHSAQHYQITLSSSNATIPSVSPNSSMGKSLLADVEQKPSPFLSISSLSPPPPPLQPSLLLAPPYYRDSIEKDTGIENNVRIGNKQSQVSPIAANKAHNDRVPGKVELRTEAHRQSNRRALVDTRRITGHQRDIERHRRKNLHPTVQKTFNADRVAARIEKESTSSSSSGSISQPVTHNRAADNKKLRHREVEKNRHRQLQAMVKTLSDRIPGKIDKETQVQTMKRAAKYCLYLRDVLTHGQQMSKDKLERLYLRSCENVNLMMAHEQNCESPSETPFSPNDMKYELDQ